MQFHLTKKQSERGGQWLLPQPEGQTICYEEPIHVDLLPTLMRALQETEWPYKFHGHFYRLRTNSGLIEEFVPASEYYKISWRAMSQKYHGATLALQSLERSAADLSRTYIARRTTIGAQNQPKLVFSLELYSLRNDFATLLFLIRSTLDQFASLVQFLSGPKSRQFSSFADLLKRCSGDAPPSEVPAEIHEHLSTDCEWFWRMRDVRDFIAHHGFVHFHLVESPLRELKFFVHHRLDMLVMAREFMTGFNALLSRLDVEYARRIRDA